MLIAILLEPCTSFTRVPIVPDDVVADTNQYLAHL